MQMRGAGFLFKCITKKQCFPLNYNIYLSIVSKSLYLYVTAFSGTYCPFNPLHFFDSTYK